MRQLEQKEAALGCAADKLERLALTQVGGRGWLHRRQSPDEHCHCLTTHRRCACRPASTLTARSWAGS